MHKEINLRLKSKEGFLLKKFNLSMLMLLVVILVVPPTSAEAYRTNNKRISSPKLASWAIASDFRNLGTIYVNDARAGTKAWNDLPQINFAGEIAHTGTASIAHFYINKNDGDVLATSRGGGRIDYRPKWKALSQVKRRETVVHEVGHELGLAHTQDKNKYISVMHATHFNNKAYPLSDDKAGIKSLYS